MVSPKPFEDPLSTTSFDDPVPPGSERSVARTTPNPTHDIELEVQRILQRLPGVTIDSLAIRRVDNGGILLEGTVQATTQSPSDFAGPIRREIGIETVVDRLRVRRTSSLDETQFDSRVS